MGNLAACRKPPNGGGCIRDDDFEDLRGHLREHDTVIGQTLEAATSAEATSKATHKVVTGLATGLAEFATRVDQRFANLELKIAGEVATRSVMVSRDWELDEPTLHGREPEQAATVWKVRAQNAEIERESLAAQIAALNARQEERDRISERVRADAQNQQKTSLDKWKLILGFVATVITSGGGVALIAHFF